MGVFNRGPRDGGDRPPFVMRPNIPGLRAIVIGVAVLLGVIILFSLLVRVTRIEGLTLHVVLSGHHAASA